MVLAAYWNRGTSGQTDTHRDRLIASGPADCRGPAAVTATLETGAFVDMGPEAFIADAALALTTSIDADTTTKVLISDTLDPGVQ